MDVFSSGNCYAFVLVDEFDEVIQAIGKDYFARAEEKVLRLREALGATDFPEVVRGILHTDSSLESQAAAYPTSYVSWLLGNPRLSSKQERTIRVASEELRAHSPRLAFAWSHRSRTVDGTGKPFDAFLAEIVHLSSGNYPGWHMRNVKEARYFGSAKLEFLVKRLEQFPGSLQASIKETYPRCTAAGFRILEEGLRMTIDSQNEEP